MLIYSQIDGACGDRKWLTSLLLPIKSRSGAREWTSCGFSSGKTAQIWSYICLYRSTGEIKKGSGADLLVVALLLCDDVVVVAGVAAGDVAPGSGEGVGATRARACLPLLLREWGGREATATAKILGLGAELLPQASCKKAYTYAHAHAHTHTHVRIAISGSSR